MPTYHITKNVSSIYQATIALQADDKAAAIALARKIDDDDKRWEIEAEDGDTEYSVELTDSPPTECEGCSDEVPLVESTRLCPDCYQRLD